MRLATSLLSLSLLPLAAHADDHAAQGGMSYGARPAYLVNMLPEGDLKAKLASCSAQVPARTDFSIGHRGAPLQFPEHTVQGYIAAAGMGAGLLECDVTFTADHELVCRHAQDDLHTTTNILISDLAPKCTTGFTPADGDIKAGAECRTSDLTLAEFRSLSPKMDSADTTATTPEAYQGGIAAFRTDLYTAGATQMTHAESIALFKSLGVKFTPELKTPVVDMPHNGFSQQDYAQKLVDEYKGAGVPASNVWLQSFNLEDVLYWIENEPEFGAQAVYLDDTYDVEGFDIEDPATYPDSMQSLADRGVQYIAPPIWMLVTLENGEIVPSTYAKQAKAAGLKIIAWSMERSGPLTTGGGWYYQTITKAVTSDAATYQVLDVLAQDVGVAGVFSDWPATVTYYANCMGL